MSCVRDESVILSLSSDTTPAPEPSTSEGVLELTQEAGSSFWQWFTGWPLQVVLILLVGTIVLVALRRVIRHTAERIATGGDKAPATSQRDAKSWFGSPLVEDAMTVANPLSNARRAQRARTVGSVLTSTANIVVGVVVLLSVLSVVGFEVGPLLASAGVVGVAIGFGAQSLVRDFISGIFILIEDQYGVGDWVDLGSGAEGEVEEVQLRTTKLRALDGTQWWVRNGEILRAGNRTQRWSRALAEVHVPVDADVDGVRAALGRAGDTVARSEELGHELLEQPSVRSGVDSVSDFSMSFTIMAQTRPGAQWTVSRALLRAAQDELHTMGAVRGERVDAPDKA
ncbi:mechanosensitive ion channel [Isoptericola sp. JC619]|uniref:Mechanosensitive ion channel n=1 Tax=Isoptericola sediminis TaxID=2733572 RepID=A0A849K6K3_9MICO|nr:mechanosensitive ion channel [Isoptericola sediminis]